VKQSSASLWFRHKKTARSFLKKRTKKLLSTCPAFPKENTAQTDKVFLLLFVHKKKAFPTSP
jgi:hypothetical protein